jgi:hypothetical protein
MTEESGCWQLRRLCVLNYKSELEQGLRMYVHIASSEKSVSLRKLLTAIEQ